MTEGLLSPLKTTYVCVCVCVRLLADLPPQGCCQARSGPGMPQSFTGLHSSLLLPVKGRRSLLLHGFVPARGGRTVAIDAVVLDGGRRTPGGNGSEKLVVSCPNILKYYLRDCVQFTHYLPSTCDTVLREL